ncbi:MAG TPA: ABC transporter ATP-binding protein [Chloroflexota bacterium]|jgi:putative ABC transport system ATP-binding protein|nr:ABC transporter ATP-binding protein [Chloroflexota bacterium]
MGIELDGVWRVYRLDAVPVVALRGARLRVGDGEFVAITGPSGSGKSTLLQIIGCLDRPTRGRVTIDRQDVGALSDRERTRLRLTKLGFVFQRFHLLSILTAIENVALPMEALGVAAEERFERAGALLEQVGLGDRLHFPPARLSGGERQRVALARAVANRPRVLLADEPTGALHSDDKAQIIRLFRRLNEAGHTIVMVTHDMEMADLADRRVEIRDGVLRDAAA